MTEAGFIILVVCIGIFLLVAKIIDDLHDDPKENDEEA